MLFNVMTLFIVLDDPDIDPEQGPKIFLLSRTSRKSLGPPFLLFDVHRQLFPRQHGGYDLYLTTHVQY